VVSLTLSNVPSGSTKLVGACIAAWLLFGYAMYLLLGELQWFTKYRHLFLSQRTPRNYTGTLQHNMQLHYIVAYSRLVCF
jgi:hypothetical protein